MQLLVLSSSRQMFFFFLPFQRKEIVRQGVAAFKEPPTSKAKTQT